MALKRVLLGTALAVASTITVGAPQAEAATGWYLGLGAGANWVQDSDWKGKVAGAGTTTSGNAEFDTGYAVAGSVGYDWGHWRAELEVTYRNNDAQCASFAGGASPCLPIPGVSLWELSQMINVLYDFDLGGRWGASLGVGAGGNLVTGKGGIFFPNNIDDYNFAAQGIAEVSYQISDRWQLFGSYHFMWTDNPDLGSPFLFGPGGSVEIEKLDHSVLIGLRFDLQSEHAAPPPEPDRAPPPAERPREFIVFFGYNKSNLTAEAARVVHEAAEAARDYGSATIIVVGHTDTSGSQSYNMRLSLRRAGAVKSGLAHEGIAPDMIQTSGKGETELMVQTGDGVKEPQNRRATISLH